MGSPVHEESVMGATGPAWVFLPKEPPAPCHLQPLEAIDKRGVVVLLTMVVFITIIIILQPTLARSPERGELGLSLALSDRWGNRGGLGKSPRIMWLGDGGRAWISCSLSCSPEVNGLTCGLALVPSLGYPAGGAARPSPLLQTRNSGAGLSALLTTLILRGG